VIARPRTAEMLRVGLANLKRVSGAGIPIAMGTDAGNPGTLHGPSVYAEMEAMQAAGMAPMEVLVASTRGGSRALGREKGDWHGREGEARRPRRVHEGPVRRHRETRAPRGASCAAASIARARRLRAIVAAEGAAAK